MMDDQSIAARRAPLGHRRRATFGLWEVEAPVFDLEVGDVAIADWRDHAGVG